MIATTEITHSQTAEAEFSWLQKHARAPRIRTMREFAEAEIVIPDGPYRGRRFRCDRQPFNGLWFDAVDSGKWPRAVACGPSQSSKTLTCFIIPALYHLFEIGETVICGAPTEEITEEKWNKDIRTTIEA